jgi:putative Ca2+/H+ antiporter (TMEM165/GDT1 family)
MEVYLVSALLVALAEMGDRTQLLANHALAALAGVYLSGLVNAAWFRVAV